MTGCWWLPSMIFVCLMRSCHFKPCHRNFADSTVKVLAIWQKKNNFFLILHNGSRIIFVNTNVGNRILFFSTMLRKLSLLFLSVCSSTWNTILMYFTFPTSCLSDFKRIYKMADKNFPFLILNISHTRISEFCHSHNVLT